jgi:hypothetical protein
LQSGSVLRNVAQVSCLPRLAQSMKTVFSFIDGMGYWLILSGNDTRFSIYIYIYIYVITEFGHAESEAEPNIVPPAYVADGPASYAR